MLQIEIVLICLSFIGQGRRLQTLVSQESRQPEHEADAESRSQMSTRTVLAPSVEHPVLLSSLAARAGQLLKQRTDGNGKPETISVFEATTGGLINAAFQSVPGASSYYHGGANIYGRMATQLYPPELRQALAEGAGRGGTSLGDGSRSNYASEANYHKSKLLHTQTVAAHMKKHLGSDWCICESGATGPTFAPPDCSTGFTAITVEGPGGIGYSIVVKSDHADREANMWQFAKAAFELLQQLLEENPIDASGESPQHSEA